MWVLLLGALGMLEPPGVRQAAADPATQARERLRRGVASVAFEVRVSPPGGATIAGVVYDRDGRGVKRACVELAPGGPGAAPPPVFSATDGSYRFTKVPAGTVRITITLESSERVAGQSIEDHHTRDPDLTVLLRPLVMVPAAGGLSVARIKREGELPGNAGRWIEVAPIALALEGYSAGCRRALARPADPLRPRRPPGKGPPEVRR
jgi:hypothetical protein